MEKSKIRKPTVAGQFYPLSIQELKEQIEAFIGPGFVSQKEALACMLPHAGYMYSGKVACETLSQIKIRDKIILLGPNHTGFGATFSIMTEGIWQTPLGEIRIDSTLAGKIFKNSEYLEDDFIAHTYEHSLEVELPILQYFKSNFEIVPIVVLSDKLNVLKEIGKEIARVIIESNIKDSILIIASSDLTHYESQTQAQKKDSEAIQAILELNEENLMDRLSSLNISMCGYAPVIIMLSAVKLLGAHTTKLIRYQTSGDVTGDKSSVVGYAGIIIY